MKKTAIIFTISLILTSVLFSCGGGGGGADSAMEDNSFTISYNANGAESGTPPVEQKGKGSSPLIISDNIGGMTKSGYLFDGWNEHPDGAGSIWRPGTSYCGDLKLYAMWVPLFNYEVINAVSPAPALDGVQRAPSLSSIRITGLTQWGDQLSSIIIPSTIDGYTVSEIGDYAFYSRDNLMNVTIPYTVTNIGDHAFAECFNLTEMTVDVVVPPTMGAGALYDCPVIINVPSLNSYKEAEGWSTYSQYIVNAGGDMYRLIYNGNGADGGTVPRTQLDNGYGTQISGNIGNLTRAGCIFDSWNTEPNGSGMRYCEGEVIALFNRNITLYAQWYHEPYTIIFNSQGAEIQANPSSIVVYAPSNTVILPTSPSRANYTFGGWYTQPNGQGTQLTANTIIYASQTVYAKWSENNCTIKYDGNNATGGSIPASQDALFNQIIPLRTNTGNLVRERYRFGGWNTQADGNGSNYAPGANYRVRGNATLYAKWLPLYTITYDSNGATGGTVPSAQQGISGEQIVLDYNSGNLSRDRYGFAGWNTQADGNGSFFAAGKNYTVYRDTTLYAVWWPLHTITYDSNGATGGTVPSAQQGIKGEQINVQPNSGNLARTGYLFDGWNTLKDGTGTTYTAGLSNYILEDNDVILYAKWIQPSYVNEEANLAIGDIVLQNGKYVSYANFSTHAVDYMAISKPAGIICYKGSTGTIGKTGKIYMVGLNQSTQRWAPQGTTGYNTEFNTSGTAGEDNWEVIQAADWNGSKNAGTNYPAFNYANTYSSTGYTRGWFLPSRDEVQKLYYNRTTINNSIAAIKEAGGFAVALPTSGYVWSSSQRGLINGICAYKVNFKDGAIDYNNKYEFNYVYAVRALNY